MTIKLIACRTIGIAAMVFSMQCLVEYCALFIPISPFDYFKTAAGFALGISMFALEIKIKCQ